MSSFRLAALRWPLELLSIVVPTRPDMSHSSNLFFVLVCGAAAVWILAMILWMGGWKRLSPYLPKGVSIGSVSGLALLVIFGLLFVVYRSENRKHPARTAMKSAQAPRLSPEHQEPATATTTAAPPPPPLAQKSPMEVTPAAKPNATAPVTLSAGQPPQIATAAPVRHDSPVAAGETVTTSQSPARRAEHRQRELTSPPAIARADIQEAPRPLPVGPASPQPRPATAAHSVRALSDTQSRQVCGAVTPYAGADVYIKWSPGANASQFANQLSRVMDCARVTVTFAGESADLGGRGVRIGTHADEGQTSDRIEPFAEAIAQALRQQGFSVAEVTGSNIPANQTAIFIGSD